MDVAELGFDVDSRRVRRGKEDLKRFGKQGKKTAADVDRSAKRTSRSLMRMATAAAGVVASMAAVRSVVTTLSGFERSMSGVAAITRASSSELKGMRKIAKELGATTEFTAAQAAEGLKFLGMAGFEASESIAAIPAVLDLATAAQMDLGRAADITSNIMSAFGIEATKAEKATDVLAAIASSANTDVQQLGDAMKLVGPVASGMGKSINDTAAAVGVLSDAGLQGTMAGTGLRRVLSRLANPTKSSTEALKKLGVELKEVNPETKSIVEIVDRLAKAGMSASEAMKIFGDRGGPAIINLTENNDKLRELTDRMGDVDGRAKEMADTFRDNLGGDIDALFSSMQGLIIAIGEAGVTGALRTLIQTLTTAIRGLTSFVDWVSQSEGALLAMKSALVGVAVMSMPAMISGTATLAGGLFKLVGGAMGVVRAMRLLKFALISTGIGAAIVLAGELIAMFMKLVEKTGSIGEAWNQLGQLMGLTIQGVADSFSSLEPAWDIVLLGLKVAWLKFQRGIAKAWATYMHGVANSVRLIGQLVPGMTQTVLAFHEAAVRAGSSVHEITVEINKTQSAANDLASTMSSTVASAFAPAIAKAKELFNWVRATTNAQGGTGTSAPPDDGSRGGQQPNAPVTPDAPAPPSINLGGGGAAGAASTAMTEAQRERNRLKQEAIRLTNEHATAEQKYAMGLDHLNKLRKTGELTQRAYNAELDDLQRKYTAAGKMATWFEGKMQAVKDGIVDAIVEGKSFKEVLMNLAKELAKAALKAALFGEGPLNSLFGGGPGLLSFIPGFAGGTDNAPGGAALVGEEGPEIVNLPKGSKVTPAKQTRQIMSSQSHRNQTQPRVQAQPAKVDVINVFDPSVVGQYLNTAEGQNTLVNVMKQVQ